MHDPREPHFLTLKHILCYLKGTIDYVLFIHPFHADWCLDMMLIGMDVLKHVDPNSVPVFILVLILFLGLQNGNMSSVDLVPKLSIGW